MYGTLYNIPELLLGSQELVLQATQAGLQVVHLHILLLSAVVELCHTDTLEAVFRSKQSIIQPPKMFWHLVFRIIFKAS